MFLTIPLTVSLLGGSAEKFVLQLTREYGKLVYLLKIVLVNFQLLEQVKSLLYGEYQLKVLELRKLHEELIEHRNLKLSREVSGEAVKDQQKEREQEQLVQENAKLKAQIKGMNASLLRMNHQIIVSSKGAK